MVADPYVVTELLRDKTWDKSKRAYSVLDAVGCRGDQHQHTNLSDLDICTCYSIDPCVHVTSPCTLQSA